MSRPEGAPAAVAAAGQAQEDTNERRDSAELQASAPTAEKIKATTTAKLAMRGYALHELADGTFLVCRWDQTRALPSLAAVQAFLAMVEGTR